MMKLDTVFENSQLVVKTIGTSSGKYHTFVDPAEKGATHFAILPFIKTAAGVVYIIEEAKLLFWSPSHKEYSAVSFVSKGVGVKRDIIETFLKKTFKATYDVKNITDLGACRISKEHSGMVSLFSVELTTLEDLPDNYKRVSSLTDVSDPVAYALVYKTNRLVI